MKPRFYVPRRCVRRSDETEVQSGLSVTPSQMMEMADAGVPISANNLQGVYDDTGGEFLLIHKRGVDMADLWNAEKKFGKSASHAIKRQKAADDLEAAAAAASAAAANTNSNPD